MAHLASNNPHWKRWSRSEAVEPAIRAVSNTIDLAERSDEENDEDKEETQEEKKEKVEQLARLTHDQHAQIAREHKEATATLSHMVKLARGEEKIVIHFYNWVAKDDEHWSSFWSRFRPDGTMTWPEFEKYVHWDNHWIGETEEVFHLIEGDNSGFITTSKAIQLKRWWQHHKDIGEVDTKQFRARFADHYGNLGIAWRLALDADTNGRCCFKVFSRVCHEIGCARHLKSIWEYLTDGHVSRCITYSDFDPEGDVLLHQFAVALTLHGGTLLQGWLQLVNDQGGRLHRDAFIERCETWGIGMRPAKWLFAVLDPNGTRFLTEYDDLDFIALWDPGEIAFCADSLEGLQKSLQGDGTAANPFHLTEADNVHDPFDLVVELSPEEHEEYQLRLRASQLIAGIDMVGESRSLQQETREDRRGKHHDIAGLKVKVDGKPPGRKSLLATIS